VDSVRVYIMSASHVFILTLTLLGLTTTSAYLATLHPVEAQTARPNNSIEISQPTNAKSAGPQNSQTTTETAGQPTATKSLNPVVGSPNITTLNSSTASAILRQKIITFKNKNKAARVINVNDKLNTINASQTQGMQNSLDRIETVLGRLERKVGNQPSAQIGTSIAEIKARLAEAKTAVQIQKDKEYTIALTEEKAAAADSIAAMNLLRSDLNSTKTQVTEVATALSTSISEFITRNYGGLNGSK
jgi:hypothetical protein